MTDIKYGIKLNPGQQSLVVQELSSEQLQDVINGVDDWLPVWWYGDNGKAGAQQTADALNRWMAGIVPSLK